MISILAQVDETTRSVKVGNRVYVNFRGELLVGRVKGVDKRNGKFVVRVFHEKYGEVFLSRNRAQIELYNDNDELDKVITYVGTMDAILEALCG